MTTIDRLEQLRQLRQENAQLRRELEKRDKAIERLSRRITDLQRAYYAATTRVAGSR